jgi:hypothetical protein
MLARARWIVMLLVVGAPLAAQAVTKAEWMKGVQDMLPGVFCKSGMYFKECFKASQAECEKTAGAATKQCLAEVADKLPATFDEKSGREWGEKVGSCAGNAFEKALAGKKSSDKRCDDASNWIPK